VYLCFFGFGFCDILCFVWTNSLLFCIWSINSYTLLQYRQLYAIIFRPINFIYLDEMTICNYSLTKLSMVYKRGRHLGLTTLCDSLWCLLSIENCHKFPHELLWMNFFAESFSTFEIVITSTSFRNIFLFIELNIQHKLLRASSKPRDIPQNDDKPARHPATS